MGSCEVGLDLAEQGLGVGPANEDFFFDAMLTGHDYRQALYQGTLAGESLNGASRLGLALNGY